MQDNARSLHTLVLFMCVFTSQAAVLVLAPILVKVAHDVHVSTAVAGQLRIVAAPVAAAVAVLLARFGASFGLRSILLASTTLVAIGSLASAAAPFVSDARAGTAAAVDGRRGPRRRRHRRGRRVEHA